MHRLPLPADEHHRQRRNQALKALPKALGLIALGTASVVLIAGVVIWAVDPTNFPNPWLGMWWALQTVTTIGYGDVVPETVAGRVFGGVIMLVGVGFISILTATVVSEFSRRAALEEREAERRDLAGVLRLLHERLDRIEEKLDHR